MDHTAPKQVWDTEFMTNIDDEVAKLTIYDDSEREQLEEDFETKVELPDGTLYAMSYKDAVRFLSKRGFRF